MIVNGENDCYVRELSSATENVRLGPKLLTQRLESYSIDGPVNLFQSRVQLRFGKFSLEII